MAYVGRSIGVAHDGKFFLPIDKILNRSGHNIVMLHVGYGQIGANHLGDLTGKTARGVDHNLRNNFALLGVDFPISRWEGIDVEYPIVANNAHTEIRRATGHGVGQP